VLPPSGAEWEVATLRALDRQQLVSFNSGLWLEGIANGFVMWGVIGVATVVAVWRRRPLLAASFFLGFGVLYLNIFFGWLLWDRPRPSIIAEGIASPGALGSYPSGHVAQAVFVYGLLGYLWARRSPSAVEKLFALLVVATVVAVVGLGRLRLGAHWPADLVAGAVIATVWTAGVAHSLARGESGTGLSGAAPRHPAKAGTQ
jgi:undecaprenyl-diphosphatase